MKEQSTPDSAGPPKFKAAPKPPVRITPAKREGAEENDPYEILGIDRSVSDDEIKAKYRSLIRENHPDVLMAKGVPQEFIDLANEKMAVINASYDCIEKERGLK